jgi:hypothetical protein
MEVNSLSNYRGLRRPLPFLASVAPRRARSPRARGAISLAGNLGLKPILA